MKPVDRSSLGWVLGLRLTLTLIVLSTLASGGLYLHTQSIAQVHGGSDLIHGVIREFFADLAWGIPLLLTCVVLVGRWTLQRGLHPLRWASQVAQGIGPNRPDLRIPEADMPAEVRPLVQATNAALDRLQLAYAAQRRFAASAAHELRTPLAVMRATAETVADLGLRDRLTTDIDQMTRLVAQLLSFARLDIATPSASRVDLCHLARDVIKQLAPQAVARSVSIGFETPVLVCWARGDAESATLILRNLIENAVLHQPSGGEVSVILSADMICRVSDHGPGIPHDWTDRIFQPFQRGAWTSASGSGLGLAIVKEAANRIGADVTLETRQAKGACFAVHFAVSEA